MKMLQFLICLILTLEAQKTDAALVNSVKSNLDLCSDIVEAVGDFLSIFETDERRRKDENLGKAVTKKLKTCRSIIDLVDGFRKKHFSPKAKKFLQGKIELQVEEVRFLTDMLKGASKKMGKILYVASKDGQSSRVFHKKCDNQGPTVVIVESSTTGAVFGGYADKSWTSKTMWMKSTTSFLFRLRPTKTKYAIKSGKTAAAMYHNVNYGPTFGAGHDLYISNNAMTSTSSTNGGSTYAFPKSPSYDLNRGKRSFKVKDYVVAKAITM